MNALILFAFKMLCSIGGGSGLLTATERAEQSAALAVVSQYRAGNLPATDPNLDTSEIETCVDTMK